MTPHVIGIKSFDPEENFQYLHNDLKLETVYARLMELIEFPVDITKVTRYLLGLRTPFKESFNTVFFHIDPSLSDAELYAIVFDLLNPIIVAERENPHGGRDCSKILNLKRYPEVNAFLNSDDLIDKIPSSQIAACANYWSKVPERTGFYRMFYESLDFGYVGGKGLSPGVMPVGFQSPWLRGIDIWWRFSDEVSS